MASTEDNILLNQIVNQGVNIYGSREKIRNQLIQFARQYLNLGDADIQKTSYLAYLIDMLSILSANQLFYDSTIYKEFFMVDAQFTESVYNLARWIGYNVPKAVPATVDVLFSIPLTFSVSQVNFSFSKYFKCKAGNIPFTISGSDNIDTDSANVHMDLLRLRNPTSPSKTSASGSIINNSVITVRDYNGAYRPVYLSSGNKSCYFTLPFKQQEVIIKNVSIPDSLAANQFYNIPVEYEGQVSQIDVWICSPTYNQTLNTSGTPLDGILDANTWDPNTILFDTAGQRCSFVKWQESVNGIYTMSARAEQYTWVGSYNKGQIFFGNGIVGKQPVPGSIVIIRLCVTQGASGNVIAHTISNGDPLYIQLNGSSVSNMNYTCTNFNASYGGKDILSIAEIKQNAIVNLSSKKRLVSDQDYNDIQTIVGNDVPLTDCVPILKRSDIKINEIMPYSILTYNVNGINEIVPTRNVTLDLIKPSFKNGKYVVPRNTIVKVGKEGSKLSYYTIFNMTIDEKTEMATYDYILQKADGVNTVMYNDKVNRWNSQCYMISAGSSYQVELSANNMLTSSYPLTIVFNVKHIPSKILEPTPPSGESDWHFADIDHEWTIEEYDLYFQIIHFRCQMTTKWGDFYTYDSISEEYVESKNSGEETIGNVKYDIYEKTYKSFKFNIDDYTNVPDGKQRFEFRIQCYAPEIDSQGRIIGRVVNTETKQVSEKIPLTNPDGSIKSFSDTQIAYVNMVWQDLSSYYCDIIIRRDMSSCMQSSITRDNLIKGIDAGYGEESIWHVHNVPSIYCEYYDSIVSGDTNGDSSSNFEMVVMQKLINNLHFDDIKMMTDFINIKFADTYGSLNNLVYNKPKYIVESRYNHPPWWDDTLPSDVISNPNYRRPPDTEEVYFVVNGKIDTISAPLSEYMGYIARRVPTYTSSNSSSAHSYTLIKPQLGDYIKVKDELDSEGRMQTCVWNGRIWRTVDDYSIPLKLKIKAEVDDTVTGKSDRAIKESIISTLSSYYQNKMGIQVPMDRSEIVRVCRSVEGVSYAELLEPEFDIRFDYEVEDLTQKELLDFTPQYVGFRALSATNSNIEDTTIDIEIVRK